MDKYLIIRVTLIVLASATLFVLISRYNTLQKQNQSEKFFEQLQQNVMPLIEGSKKDGAGSGAGNVEPSEPLTNEDYRGVDYSGQTLPNDCFPKDKLTAEDLLPSDAANTKWAQVNPAGQGSVKDQNFLQAGYHVGLNTTQGTMKNANLQLRSEPAAPQVNVSPWLNSSYSPDLMRRPLEIGENC